MNSNQRQEWVREALDMAFSALASDSELSNNLVYKGARVLALRLGGDQRASYDLDANLNNAFVNSYPSWEQQAQKLHSLIEGAMQSYIDSQDPIRYEILNVKVLRRPSSDHPLGWNAFEVVVKLRDFMNEGVLGLPNIEFDVAAPEDLGAHAISQLGVGTETVFAYTLERISGEKMRAFLSSLPSYRKKVKKPGDAVRTKDLYDICKILRAHPIHEEIFWKAAAEEFRLACESRYVDCNGIDTFSEDLDVTGSSYQSNRTLPSDINFTEAWSAIREIVDFWTALGIFPLRFSLPKGPVKT